MLQSKNEQHKKNGGIEPINSRNKKTQDSNENLDEEPNDFIYLDNEATEPGTNQKEDDEPNLEIIRNVNINENQNESVKGEEIIMEVKQEWKQNKEEIVNSPCHIASNKISSKNNQLKKKRKRAKEKSEKKERSESLCKQELNLNEFKVDPILIPTPKKEKIQLELFPNLKKNRQKAPPVEIQSIFEAIKSQNLYKKSNFLNRQNISPEKHKKGKKAPLDEIQLLIEAIESQNLYKKYNFLIRQIISSEKHKKGKKSPLDEIQLLIENIKTKIFTKKLTLEYKNP